MIADVKFLSDQLANPHQGSAVRWKSIRQGSTIQHPLQLLLLGRAQFRLASGSLPLSQASHALGFDGLRPITDGRSAHAQLPRNFGLGKFACSQQASAFQAPFLHLITRQVGWFPYHAPYCKSISVNLNSRLSLSCLSSSWQSPSFKRASTCFIN